ncbi:Similar to CorA-like Mg2+ transporter family protein [Coccidioides posadasii C735 delta SOWgp]; acc. no. XP_003066511 [Pyronema omphalodes CBS 100304]|nr:Similar to CorA-like Mg2+ transporter family protein [Coccidioides posadasii C735 delta SOWgp]; acc. no. XP_003066511 [Pyronema omphalodes CBS 100304]
MSDQQGFALPTGVNWVERLKDNYTRYTRGPGFCYTQRRCNRTCINCSSEEMENLRNWLNKPFETTTVTEQHAPHDAVQRHSAPWTKQVLQTVNWGTISDTRAKFAFGLDYIVPISGMSLSGSNHLMITAHDPSDNRMIHHHLIPHRITVFVELDVQGQLKCHKTSVGSSQPSSPDSGFNNTIIIFEQTPDECYDFRNQTLLIQNLKALIMRRFPTSHSSQKKKETELPASGNDDAATITSLIIRHVWKEIGANWSSILQLSEQHLDILQDQFYDAPTDEQHAVTLWKNTAQWSKMKKLVNSHSECALGLERELLYISNWMESGNSIDQVRSILGVVQNRLEKLEKKIKEDLIVRTGYLSDLMYRIVGIRDTRESIELSNSMKRISWITFIFLPPTALASIFGMNVSTFQANPSILWYFVAAIPLMFCVFLAWYTSKYLFSDRNYTKYRYKHISADLSHEHPDLWNSNGPLELGKDSDYSTVARIKWDFVTRLWKSMTSRKLRESHFLTEGRRIGVLDRLQECILRKWTQQIKKRTTFKPERFIPKRFRTPNRTATGLTLSDGKNSVYRMQPPTGVVSRYVARGFGNER